MTGSVRQLAGNFYCQCYNKTPVPKPKRRVLDWTARPDLPLELRIYLAGLFDGEGSVTIRSGRVAAKNNKTHWSLVAVISNTDGEALYALRDAARGVGAIVASTKQQHKTLHQWVLSSRGAVWFLRQIRPWLRIKERQADLGFRFAALVAYRGSTALPLGNVLMRHHLRRELMKLNKAGRPAHAIPRGRPHASRHPQVAYADLPLALRLYLAGLFDGEGTIAVRGDRAHKTGHTSWSLRVTIGVTDDGAVRSLHEETGRIGAVHVAPQGRHKPMTVWTMSTTSGAWFLAQIRPWMRIRERQADLAMQFAALTAAAPRTRYNKPVFGNLFARQVILARIRCLNQKGREAL